MSKSIQIGFDYEERTTIWSIVIHAYKYKELVIIHETHRAAEFSPAVRTLAYNPESCLVAAGLSLELATLLNSHDRSRVGMLGTVDHVNATSEPQHRNELTEYTGRGAGYA